MEFPSSLAFFGLTASNIAEYRSYLFSQIHDIVFHGKGGYDWTTVYNMPSWLRKFTYHKIVEFYKKEAEVNPSSKGEMTADNIKIPEEVMKKASDNRKQGNIPSYLKSKS